MSEAITDTERELGQTHGRTREPRSGGQAARIVIRSGR
jgi:hypothetical protein